MFWSALEASGSGHHNSRKLVYCSILLLAAACYLLSFAYSSNEETQSKIAGIESLHSRDIRSKRQVWHKVTGAPRRRVTRRKITRVLKNPVPSTGNVTRVIKTMPMRVPPRVATPPPVTASPLAAITTPAPAASDNTNYRRPRSRQDLEDVLKIPGVKCGTVPIYDKLYKRSINESFEVKPDDDDDDDGDFRILHGLDSVVGEWPWIVRLSYCVEDDVCWTCTGTLLNERWLITAGHCGYEKDVNKYKAYFGLYDLITPESTSYSMKVEKMVVHEDYNNLLNDLTLMKLEKPVKFSDHVQPACLVRPLRNTVKYARHRKCYTVGYGLGVDMNQVERLQKLEINAKPPSACNADKLAAVHMRPYTVCIGPPDGKTGGSCKGDSGGPDLCYDPQSDSWEIFGTVSYGPTVCDRDDDDQWHTVSMDLANYRSWILRTIAEN